MLFKYWFGDHMPSISCMVIRFNVYLHLLVSFRVSLVANLYGEKKEVLSAFSYTSYTLKGNKPHTRKKGTETVCNIGCMNERMITTYTRSQRLIGEKESFVSRQGIKKRDIQQMEADIQGMMMYLLWLPYQYYDKLWLLWSYASVTWTLVSFGRLFLFHVCAWQYLALVCVYNQQTSISYCPILEVSSPQSVVDSVLVWQVSLCMFGETESGEKVLLMSHKAFRTLVLWWSVAESEQKWTFMLTCTKGFQVRFRCLKVGGIRPPCLTDFRTASAGCGTSFFGISFGFLLGGRMSQTFTDLKRRRKQLQSAWKPAYSRGKLTQCNVHNGKCSLSNEMRKGRVRWCKRKPANTILAGKSVCHNHSNAALHPSKQGREGIGP